MPASRPIRPARSRLTTALAAIGAGAILVSAAAPVGAANPSGFKTSQAPMLTGVGGTSVRPLLTAGEALPGGYRFEALPDGIAVRERGQGRLDVFVNHETSTVPFPWAYTGSGTGMAVPTKANSQNDFDNSQLSHLVLNQHSGGILSGSMAIDSSANYQRFCSNFLADEEQGFDRPIVFTNEEATDFVSRTGTAWPAPQSEPPSEQAGVVVAYDVRTGQYRSIYGMGRHNHENSVAIPGFDELVLLSGDDTFTSNPAQSQVYAYIADDTDAVWNDEGSLWGFRADDSATYNDYYDFPVGASFSIPGEFVEIDRADAVGTQAAPEADSPTNGVFQFVRIEDIAYDRTNPNVVYLADSGRGQTGLPGPGKSTNGRITEDGPRPRKPAGRPLALDPDRGRRQPGEDPRRDPPAGQPRDDRQQPPHHRGPGQQSAVPVRNHRSECHYRANLALRSHERDRDEDGRRARQPGRR